MAIWRRRSSWKAVSRTMSYQRCWLPMLPHKTVVRIGDHCRAATAYQDFGKKEFFIRIFSWVWFLTEQTWETGDSERRGHCVITVYQTTLLSLYFLFSLEVFYPVHTVQLGLPAVLLLTNRFVSFQSKTFPGKMDTWDKIFLAHQSVKYVNFWFRSFFYM